MDKKSQEKSMLQEKNNESKLIYNFKIDDYVPDDHLVRYIDKYIKFDFIREKVRHLYSHTGRPSIDPVVLFKMLLLGYLYDISSERQLEQEINVNLAFRWFIKYDIDERVPDHSTLSQTRRRKFSGSTLFRDIFETLVGQCKEFGFIKGETILTDSTHVKANASMESLKEIVITPEEFIKRLDENLETDTTNDEDESDTDKKDKKYSNDTHRSSSDPDSRLMSRKGKPKGLHYLEHRSIDSNGYIVDSFITPGNLQDCEPFLDRIMYMRNNLQLPVRQVVADRGYGTANIYHDLLSMQIEAFIPLRYREKERPGMFSREDYIYNAEEDNFTCPAGQILHKRSKKVRSDGSFVYAGREDYCSDCHIRSQCTTGKLARQIKRLEFQDSIDCQLQAKGSQEWRILLRKRKTLLEGSFAISKMYHGLNRAKMRGLERVQEQALMTAISQNIKKMIKEFKRLERAAESAILFIRLLMNGVRVNRV
jgi:transposase